MNKIILIGYIGIKRAHLNITPDEARKRYCNSEKITREEFDREFTNFPDIIEFKDEFQAYDIWEN